MEASYKKYKGKVNFLWVYGREAHPEEKPFAPGKESKDLGWTHPYTITKTVQERAQRATWLKTDPNPDYTIPMMMDFVGDPSHTDDAIRQTYWGGGYYSGVVIDCDGTIRKIHFWGWYDKGGEWMGLNLTPVQDLHSYLDSYLKSPPACYKPAAAPDAGSTPVDAGEPGVELGTTKPDAGGVAADTGGTTTPPPADGDEGGCSCSLRSAPRDAAPGLLLALLVAGFALLRRRR